MSVMTGRDTAVTDLLRAFGLDPSMIVSCVIRISVDEPVTIVTEQYMDRRGGGGTDERSLSLLMKRYHLVCEDEEAVGEGVA